MKNLCTRFAAIVAVCLLAAFLAWPIPAQSPYGAYAPPGAAAPTVVHIHHHYNSSNLVSGYGPSTAWSYGQQPNGSFVQPWKQNWGHLGFTGYLGQHGGGVDVTPDSLNQFTGLVVDTVTPGSPAANLGLVPGDFIRSINGETVDNYKQVTELFEETAENPNGKLTMAVWNPHTRRTQTLTANVED